MKNILKVSVLLMCFLYCTESVFAQSEEKAFYGSWELDQSAYVGQQHSSTRYIKIFNADHTFTNLQIYASKTFISHSGKYQVNDNDYYTERALYVKEGMNFVFKDKDVKIHYHFSDDKKWLTLSFTVENGTSFTERWRRSEQATASNNKAGKRTRIHGLLLMKMILCVG
jgi:hypothetical protein